MRLGSLNVVRVGIGIGRVRWNVVGKRHVGKQMMEKEMFVETTKPPRRELPSTPRRWPAILSVACVGVAGWAAFLLIATNNEMFSSSAVRQIIRTAVMNEELRELLGDGIHPKPEWYLNGDPWIKGKVYTFILFVSTHAEMVLYRSVL